MSSKSDINDQATQYEIDMVANQVAFIQGKANTRELQSTGYCRLETCGEELEQNGQLFCDHRCAEIYEKQKRIF